MKIRQITLSGMIFLLSVFAPLAQAQKLKPEEIIAKHLDSITTADKRALIKSIIAVGEVKVEYISQKNQPASGRIVIASEGQKMFYGMSLNASDYAQERIVFDGNKTSVGFVRAGARSVLGNFIQSNNSLVSQGLLAGALTSSWALLAAADRGAKISSGTKKIDGKEYYTLNFSPKKGGDIDINMYFDQQTFRHVRTEYSRTSSSSIGRTIDDSARQNESRIKVTEEFSDFKDFMGVSFPNKYKLHYLVSGGSTTEISWTCNLSEFAINQAIDAGTFDVDK
ncbi:MAG: hypothetical protein IPI64_11460 [Chloracidobacterium sp.]|nr:hypothetical protein [Chloracidobacterium sp.]